MEVHHDAEPDLKDTQKAESFLADAQAGNDSEVKMGLFAALKLYPKASAWSIAISIAVVMEGMFFSAITPLDISDLSKGLISS
jgi:hypothetical protein